MRIIDADCHISPFQDAGNNITVDELISTMDEAGVTMALTWLQPPYLREVAQANAYVHESMQKYPQRILGFGWADPHLGVDQAQDMVKKCIYEYGFFGVKLNGAQNSFFIDDPQLSLPVIEEIAKTGTVLAFHAGADAYHHTHPFRVAKIAKMFPELPILMVHMGGAGLPDLSREAIEFAKECPNITLIGSAIHPPPILQAVQTLGADRVCFGSDTPFQFMRVELAKYHALFANELSTEDLELVLGGNIARVLGID